MVGGGREKYVNMAWISIQFRPHSRKMESQRSKKGKRRGKKCLYWILNEPSPLHLSPPPMAPKRGLAACNTDSPGRNSQMLCCPGYRGDRLHLDKRETFSPADTIFRRFNGNQMRRRPNKNEDEKEKKKK